MCECLEGVRDIYVYTWMYIEEYNSLYDIYVYIYVRMSLGGGGYIHVHMYIFRKVQEYMIYTIHVCIYS